jgi:hypothetical protein
MDSVAGFLIDALAKAVEDSRKKGTATGASAALARTSGGSRQVAGGPTSPRGASGQVAAPRPAAPAPERAGGFHHARLLRAFRPGAGLLAAFVLAEAISPPLALRER